MKKLIVVQQDGANTMGIMKDREGNFYNYDPETKNVIPVYKCKICWNIFNEEDVKEEAPFLNECCYDTFKHETEDK